MSQSLERGLQTLIFLSTRKSIGVTELAEHLEINKSSAFRIFESLQKFDMVEQDKDTAKYKLGPTILGLSQQVYKNLNIISISRPFMKKLASEVGESVHLSILANNHAVIIEQIVVNARLVVNASVGNCEPLHCSSIGKCLLAFSDISTIEEIISNLSYEKFTEKTITDEKNLRKELEKIKEQKYAIDNGELSDEIKCIATPIFNHKGEVLYSLGISGPNSRMTEDKMNVIIKKLSGFSNLISSNLGFVK